jgi:hypothetical protein
MAPLASCGTSQRLRRYEGRAKKGRLGSRSPLEGRNAMFSEFFSIAFRGGIAVGLLIVALQFSGLLH